MVLPCQELHQQQVLLGDAAVGYLGNAEPVNTNLKDHWQQCLLTDKYSGAFFKKT